MPPSPPQPGSAVPRKRRHTGWRVFVLIAGSAFALIALVWGMRTHRTRAAEPPPASDNAALLDPDHRQAIDRAVGLVDHPPLLISTAPGNTSSPTNAGTLVAMGPDGNTAAAVPAAPAAGSQAGSALSQWRRFAIDNAHPALDDLPPLSHADQASLQESPAGKDKPAATTHERARSSAPTRIPDRLEGEDPVVVPSVLEKAAISARWHQP